MHALTQKAKAGFQSLPVGSVYVQQAVLFLDQWLTHEEFAEYVPQITHLIETERFEYLLDSFYQVIPFGTGGRRGEVGIGPNRINPWTIRASAQGHAQYLRKKYGEAAETRGVIFAYDVRQFFGHQFLNSDLPNPVLSLTSKDLAIAAAEVYAANGIPVRLFSDIRTTPEISFAIRHLGAVAGAMFSASHNPPNHNGKKVYDETGGQLVPPHDEELVREVTEEVKELRRIPYAEAAAAGMITIVGEVVDEAYLEAAAGVSLSTARAVRIVYTPLHGCGLTSVYAVLGRLGFDVSLCPATSQPDGAFSRIMFNIANPEVVESFATTVPFANEKNADIILSSDPDADRIGIMVKHGGSWVFLSGNEIALILAEYAIRKWAEDLRRSGLTGLIIKTTVTTNLLAKMCAKNDIEMVGELLIGFKYVADIMNALERDGQIGRFLFGCEESHGYLAGNYARDKDAVTAAVWLAELAAELKKDGGTLVHYLDRIYENYGYYKNYLMEIRLLGAAGKEKIDRIQRALDHAAVRVGRFRVERRGLLDRTPIVPKPIVQQRHAYFHLAPVEGTEHMKVRSGRPEPNRRSKFILKSASAADDSWQPPKCGGDRPMRELEKAVMLACYRSIGVDFPERGFLLFWQLPLDDQAQIF